MATSTNEPVAVLATAAALIGATFARWGYGAYVGDHHVLMPRGLHAADSTSFARDWMTLEVAQPHAFFDVVTRLAAQAGAVGPAYLLFTLASLVVFALALVHLARAVGITAPLPLVAIALVAALGPESPLGSTTPVLGLALPHALGGSLACLALAQLAARRALAAALLLAPTAIAHMQHGMNAALVALAYVAWRVLRERPSLGRADAVLASASVVTMGYALWSASRLGLVGQSDFARLCARYIPFHCEATLWPSSWLLPLVPLAVGACALVLVARAAAGSSTASRARVGAALVCAAPVVVVAVGVLCDRLDVPLLGALAQKSNVYRFVSLAYPGTAVGLVALLVAPASLLSSPMGSRTRGAGALTGAVGLFVWLTTYTGVAAGAPLVAAAACALLAVVIAAAAIATDARGGGADGRARAAWTHAAPLGVLVVLAALLARVPAPALSVEARDNAELTQRLAGLPTDALIVAPPHLVPLRLASRRAVLADTKAIPYGGAALAEWERRIASLGGYDVTGQGFADLTPEALLALVAAHRATHVALHVDDAKTTALAARLRPVARIDVMYTLYEVTQ